LLVIDVYRGILIGQCQVFSPRVAHFSSGVTGYKGSQANISEYDMVQREIHTVDNLFRFTTNQIP